MKIDKKSVQPLYMQIYDNIVDEIINGYLIPEQRLPSRRELSKELGISERTIDNAYQKLASDEYIIARPGSGYYVSSDRVWDDEHKVMKSRIYNFSTNGVETSKLPFAQWSKLLKITAREDSNLFQHGEKAGEWCLRKSIRRMLFRTQGIKCRTEQIIIGPGAEDLLRELFSLLAKDAPIIMNNYYNYRVHGVAKGTRLERVYVQNDTDGIDTDELKKYDRGVLYQKPVHDLPTAVTLSEEKRQEIVNWLGEGKYVIEDSSENDYWYTERKKTLWEMAEGKNVIYLGSFSMTISPSMKIGYIIAPDEIVKRWFKEKRFYTNRVSRVEQVTLSKFIDLGYYEKHLGYMRSIYREKTLAVRRAINSTALGKKAHISGDEAGMYCIVKFDVDVDEEETNEYLAQNGIKLTSLNNDLADKSKQIYPPNTYIVGYGEMTISQIREGIELWAKLWKEYL